MPISPSTVRARPGMYVMPYEQKLNAASFVLNTLMSVATNYRDDAPQVIDFTAADYHFSLNIVQQPKLIIDVASRSLADVFSIEHHAQGMNDPNLVFLKPIVWFSEYCLVGDVSGDQLHKQMFLNGEPIGSPHTQPSGNSNGASLSFHFTLPPGIFESVILEQTSLRAAISTWKRYFLRQRKDWKSISTQYHWRKTSEYCHSLKVILTRKNVS